MDHLGITEVVIIHCNIVNNDYPQDSRVFVPNKLFGQLLFLKKCLSQNFYVLNYGLLIKILNIQR